MSFKWKNVYWNGPGDSIAETILFDTKEEAIRDSTQGFLKYLDTIAVPVEDSMMFEVGKKYQSIHVSSASPLTCVWTDGDTACMKNDIGVTLRYAKDFKHYQEYKEPIKHVRYFNVYPSGVSHSAFLNASEANQYANNQRIGCVRVEFTEGQYDD